MNIKLLSDTILETTKSIERTVTAQWISIFAKEMGITPPDEDPKQAPSNHSPHFHVHEPALKYGVRSLAYLAIDYLRRD